ncbi:heat-inducible transcription repressor HrcA [Alicyclobacillus hesperidum subsp. aegles]|uniref:heat-inducible transcriptional repressor HrcA n=1 Tax=Alicyclobacillus hesperidum TaxID=89784 RepID=UPI000719342F|nr:heat-inducible transcriptional repressor HrcA [Alicyclobacillus hesperidum]KRW91696.1 HrcA family transcriptional regulator [Alicyclobacillus tengchongensis]GLG00314.1 heat-inducible transcription repressor HrcA [Alicyclobacillus hesperidum subsp. aegles]
MLTPRQQLILSAVIEDYVRMAEPVGSRALAKHEEIQFSPATIRNEMADLEEMGYLTQPHTSSGRIPSQKGYRFYVDNLLRQGHVDRSAGAFLKDFFTKRIDEVEQVVREVSTMLSSLTRQTSIVLGPNMYTEKVRKIELIPIGSGRAVAILVTDTGHVENAHVHFSEDIRVDDVEAIVNVLNDKLVGVPISKLRSNLYAELAEELSRTVERFEDALAVLSEVCQVTDREETVYIGGAANVLSQPEFHDVEKAQSILSLLEQGGTVTSWFPKDERGLTVRIGAENSVGALQDCTVMTTTYSLYGHPVGHIGVLGPTRMDYNRIMQILQYTSAALTEFLTRWSTGN